MSRPPPPRESYALRELEAWFLRHEVRREPVRRVRAKAFAARPSGPYADADIEEVISDVVHLPQVETLAEAHGVWFLCPKCFAENAGRVGTHAVLCWFVGKVPDDAEPKPGRWIPAGTGLDDLTFIGPQAASILLQNPKGCRWHGFVRAGRATLR